MRFLATCNRFLLHVFFHFFAVKGCVGWDSRRNPRAVLQYLPRIETVWLKLTFSVLVLLYKVVCFTLLLRSLEGH